MMRLKEIRTGKRLTQEQVAERAGIDQSTVSELERGVNPNPTLQTILALARALDVDPAELFPVPDANPPETT